MSQIALSRPLRYGVGYVSQWFGANKKLYWDRYKIVGGHNGVDYAARSGTEILAMHDGIVFETGYQTTGYGVFLRLDQDSEWRTIYGHMLFDSLRFKKGDIVYRGDVIGLMGTTGFSTGSHLHAGLFDKNKKAYVNPVIYRTV